jgi:hypothetical protein
MIAESVIIWQKTLNAFAFSTDGTLTWKEMNSRGNLSAKVLTEI